MIAKSQAKFTRMSPRKVRLVTGFIAGKDVKTAREQLTILDKKAGPIVLKVLNSAISNAKNKKAEEKELYVSQAFVDEGPTLKRWRARAFGRAAQIRKRTSRITVFVSDEKKDKPTKSK